MNVSAIIVTRDTDHAWAAGVLDGEGSIQISRQNLGHTLQVSVGQSGNDGPPAMLLRLRQMYNGHIHENRSTRTTTDAVRKPHYVWQVVARQAEAFLREVLPYLVAKKAQAEIAIEYRERAVGRLKFDEAAGYRQALKEAKR
jgi:hypothetical protein